MRALVIMVVALMEPLAIAPAAGASIDFDGKWNVDFFTKTGDCVEHVRVDLQVEDGEITYPGQAIVRKGQLLGQKSISGRVAPGGAVRVTISMGANYAVGSGHIRGGSGAGTWQGQLANMDCTGVWRATRL